MSCAATTVAAAAPAWGWGQLLPSLGAVVAFAIAVGLWRIQVVGKRKMDVAEEVLVAMQTAIDALEGIRAPLLGGGEMKAARVFFDKDPEDFGETVSSYLTVLHRVTQYAEEFAPIQKTRIHGRYFIGQEVENGLEELLKIRNDIISNAQTAAQLVGNMDKAEIRHDAFLQKVRLILFRSSSDTDLVASRIQKSRQLIERMCTPHLRNRAAFWPMV